MPQYDTLYTARYQLPEELEQGRDNTLKLPVYDPAGALAIPDEASSTFSLYDDTNTALISDQLISVSGSIAQYTVPAATIADKAYGEGWRVEWKLLMPDGQVHTFGNRASLVRVRLYPVITDADLYRVCSAINPSNASLTNQSDFQDKREEAWVQLMGKLIARGNRPNLMLQPSDLRNVHIYWTLAMIFDDLESRLNEGYSAQADSYRRSRNEAWDVLSFVYGSDADDGTVTDGRRSKTPSIWLTSNRGKYRRYGY